MSALSNFSASELDLLNPTSGLDFPLYEDFPTTGNELLYELDPNELEELLNNNNWPVEQVHEIQEIDVNESFPMVQENLVAAQGCFSGIRQESESILLITVPEPLQEAQIFNKFPTVPMDDNVFEKIQTNSDGFDGACLRLGKQATKRSLSPVRRTPLQVIQYVVNKPPNQSSPSEVTKRDATKRKQTFELNREDGVSFDDGILSPQRKKKRTRRYPRDQAFVWADASDEETERAPESIDETQRCPGCKKVFKKLASHRCKKLQQQTDPLEITIVETAEEKPQTELQPTTTAEVHSEVKPLVEFFCLGCNREFKSKRSLTAHVKKCLQRSFTFESSTGVEEPVKPQEEDEEPKAKRQLRSSCPK